MACMKENRSTEKITYLGVRSEISHSILTVCMLGNFACLFCCLLIFFQNIIFQNIFKEYHQCRTVWIQIRTDIPSGLIGIQTVCTDYQQATKVATSTGFYNNVDPDILASEKPAGLDHIQGL